MTHADIAGVVSLGDLVAVRGAFCSPGRTVQTLTVYRVRGGKIHNIWDVEQIAD